MTEIIYPKRQKPSKLNRLTKYASIGAIVGGIVAGAVAVFNEYEINFPQNFTHELLSKVGDYLPEEVVPKKNFLDDLLNEEFICPVSIDVVKDDGGTAAYVFDAGNGSLHRFGDNGHTIGKYLSSNASWCEEYLQKFSRQEQVSLQSPFKLVDSYLARVDNLDGTRTTYTVPELKFLNRELGTLEDTLSLAKKQEGITKIVGRTVYLNKNVYPQDYNRDASCEYEFGADELDCNYYSYSKINTDITNPNLISLMKLIRLLHGQFVSDHPPEHYTLFHDAPSRYKVNFTEVFPLFGFHLTLEVMGNCSEFPVLAFYEKENGSKALFGYVCKNDEIEKYRDLPMDNASTKKPLSVSSYKNIILLLRERASHVEKIEINNSRIRED